MINDREFLHGAAILKLINYGDKITITHAREIHPSLYLVENERTQSAIIFKVSTKPTSAWSFTLSSQEDSALNTLHRQHLGFSVFLALVCHKDGICCIAADRLRSVLDRDLGIGGQHISVSRRPRGSYHVSGPGRQQMAQSVPQSDWPGVFLSSQDSNYE